MGIKLARSHIGAESGPTGPNAQTGRDQVSIQTDPSLYGF